MAFESWSPSGSAWPTEIDDRFVEIVAGMNNQVVFESRLLAVNEEAVKKEMDAGQKV